MIKHNTIDTEKMTDAEINEGIQLLKKCIKYQALEYTHANPVLEHCYISSVGTFEGLYFPNSIIQLTDGTSIRIHLNREFYNFICVSKVQNELGIILRYDEEQIETLQNDNLKKWLHNLERDEYTFIPFISVLYTYEELRLYEALQKRLNEFNQELKVLNSIKFKTKKDGSDFQNILNNFETKPEAGKTIHAYWDNYALIVSLSEEKTSRSGCVYNDYSRISLWQNETMQDIKKEVQSLKEERKKDIQKINKDIQNIKEYTKKINNFSEWLHLLSFTAQQEIIKRF